MKHEIAEVVEGAKEVGQPGPYTPERRRFLEVLMVALAGFGATIVGIPVIGVLIGPLVIHRPAGVWRAVGRVGQFKAGETVEVAFTQAAPLPWGGVTDRTGAWLRRESGDRFTAFSLYCQHLGCPVRWNPQAQLFLCPCHGGVYYVNGAVAAGPPPRALQTYPVRVRNGQVEILARPVPFPY